jgi:hypothetical protein
MHDAHVLVVLTFADAGKETYVEVGRFLERGKPVVWLPVTPRLVPRDTAIGQCLALENSKLVYRAKNEEDVLVHLADLSEKIWFNERQSEL